MEFNNTHTFLAIPKTSSKKENTEKKEIKK